MVKRTLRVVGRARPILVALGLLGGGCNAILGNDDGFVDPGTDATIAPPTDARPDGRSHDASGPDAPGMDRSATDHVALEDAADDPPVTDTTVAERAVDGVGSEASADARSSDAPDADPPGPLPDAPSGVDALDDRSSGSDANDARGWDVLDVATDRSAPSPDGAGGADSSDTGPMPEDADATGLFDGSGAGNEAASDAPTCAPTTGADCGLCGGKVMCNGVCSNLGNPNNCVAGRCGLGCAGPCECLTNQLCSTQGICQPTCPAGQMCCGDPDEGGCNVCVKPPAECP